MKINWCKIGFHDWYETKGIRLEWNSMRILDYDATVRKICLDCGKKIDYRKKWDKEDKAKYDRKQKRQKQAKELWDKM